MKPFVRSVMFTGVLAMAASSRAVAQKIAEQLPRSQDSRVENRRMFLDARAPDLPPRYSASEIRKMIYYAKTPDDFRRLADYLDFRSMEFEQKAGVQLKELQRLLALRFHARIYATQIDNTRELIKRYKAQAQGCSARATAYRARSTLDTEMVASVERDLNENPIDGHTIPSGTVYPSPDKCYARRPFVLGLGVQVCWIDK